MYLNSPTLVVDRGVDAPPGGATVTAFVPASYETFKYAADASPGAYAALVDAHTAAVLDVIEARFIPGLRGALDYLSVRTPLDHARALRSPNGAVYGKSFRPRDINIKVPWRSPLNNLYFAGQYTAQAGIVLAIQSACFLYEQLMARPI
jgi:phytoene dehydrogenase-like protein